MFRGPCARVQAGRIHEYSHAGQQPNQNKPQMDTTEAIIMNMEGICVNR
jgi:hypothetical protein